jgi:hypothetical protein
MKNIHVLPTKKSSRLLLSKKGNLQFLKDNSSTNPNNHFVGNYQNIYITSDEEIKEGDWVLGDYPDNPIGKVIAKYGQEFTAQSLNGDKYGLAEYDSKKIILTDNKDLIKDGVQAIDDEFLEWFVNNPSCEEVEVKKIELNTDYRSDWKQKFRYKIIIPKEEPKQETLEDAKIRFIENMKSINPTGNFLKFINLAIDFGAKWKQEQIYNQIKELYDNENITGFSKRAYAQCLDIIEQLKKK